MTEQILRQARLYRYRLPIDSGVILNGERALHRQGLIISLRQLGREGLGEIAPLPGFSQETMQQAERDAVLALRNWQSNGLESDEAYCASVRCGFSFALAELNASLPFDGNFATAFLSTLESKDAVDSGVVKVKLGRQKTSLEVERLIHHMAARPHCRYRLDANQSWSLAQGEVFFSSMPAAAIEKIDFVEEPCRDYRDSLLLAQRYAIPLAWDESLRQQPLAKWMESEQVAAWVIKPMLMGSIAQCSDYISHAAERGISAIISSSLETSLGLSQLARLAAQLTPNITPGLDTLGVYQHQLIRRWPDSTLPLNCLSELEEVTHA